MRLHSALVQYIFDYGCVECGSSKFYFLERLDPVCNAVLRLASGVFHSLPVVSLLQIECDSMPLDISWSHLTFRDSFAVSASLNLCCAQHNLAPLASPWHFGRVLFCRYFLSLLKSFLRGVCVQSFSAEPCVIN